MRLPNHKPNSPTRLYNQFAQQNPYEEIHNFSIHITCFAIKLPDHYKKYGLKVRYLQKTRRGLDASKSRHPIMPQTTNLVGPVIMYISGVFLPGRSCMPRKKKASIEVTFTNDKNRRRLDENLVLYKRNNLCEVMHKVSGNGDAPLPPTKVYTTKMIKSKQVTNCKIQSICMLSSDCFPTDLTKGPLTCDRKTVSRT